MAYGVKEYMLEPVVKKDIHEMLDIILPVMKFYIQIENEWISSL